MEQSQMQPNRTVFMDGVAVQEGGFQKSQKLAKHPYCSINFPAPLNSVVLWLCGNPEEEYREQHIGAFRLMFAKGQVESPPQRSKAILPLPSSADMAATSADSALVVSRFRGDNEVPDADIILANRLHAAYRYFTTVAGKGGCGNFQYVATTSLSMVHARMQAERAQQGRGALAPLITGEPAY
jgi:hypothetical protein